MPKLAKKPILALGATAMLVFGAAGISAAATRTGVAGTTPESHRSHAQTPKQNPTALAKALGVSVTQLEDAVTAARAKVIATDPATDAATEVKTIASALGADEATIQAALDAERPPQGDGANGARPAGTTPPADRPTGTTPAAGGPDRGPGGRGGHGGGSLADRTALVSALAKATGKTEATVKAALAKVDEARAAARKARDAEFASNLAVQLGLSQAKVAAALEASRPAKPTRAAKQGTTQAK